MPLDAVHSYLPELEESSVLITSTSPWYKNEGSVFGHDQIIRNWSKSYKKIEWQNLLTFYFCPLDLRNRISFCSTLNPDFLTVNFVHV
jgi:hypothetical protein